MARGRLVRLLPLQLPNFDLRRQQCRGALFERRLGPTEFLARGDDLLLRLDATRFDVIAKRGQFGVCGGRRARSKRSDQLACGLTQILWQVGVLDTHSTLLS